MCGVFGIFTKQQTVAQDIFDALTLLQHRGQDAAGIATCGRDYRFTVHKGNGLVRDVIRTRHMRELRGGVGIGHVRYPTAGGSCATEAQPFYVNSPFGISLAHNGNLTNADQLRQQLFKTDLRNLATGSDSEVLLNILAHELSVRCSTKPTADDVFAAVRALHKRVRGGYAVTAIIAGVGLLAFRDPHGVRPLCFGQRTVNGDTEYAVASESVALPPLDFELVDDVAAGEAVFVDWQGGLHREQCADAPQLTPCLFEYVYLARPDSVIDGVSVYKARLRSGVHLAESIKAQCPDLDIDVVMPIPDSGRSAALEVSYHLGKKFREGFIKNRYIGRTFIMPGQEIRKKGVKMKLSPIELEFRNKSVLLVDDSIVRGTTSKQIVQMARDAGARKVYFASAAPPVRYPNVYGIDMPTRGELVANGASEDEVGRIIGADGLFYLSIEDLRASVAEGNPSLTQFEGSCFDGEYCTGDIDAEYLTQLERGRGGVAEGESNPVTLL